MPNEPMDILVQNESSRYAVLTARVGRIESDIESEKGSRARLHEQFFKELRETRAEYREAEKETARLFFEELRTMRSEHKVATSSEHERRSAIDKQIFDKLEVIKNDQRQTDRYIFLGCVLIIFCSYLFRHM